MRGAVQEYRYGIDPRMCVLYEHHVSQLFFMKSIRLRPKPDPLASDAFFFARMASRPLCFRALALFLLLAFVDSGVVGVELASVCDALVIFAPVDSPRGCDRSLLLGVVLGRGNLVTLPQEPHL